MRKPAFGASLAVLLAGAGAAPATDFDVSPGQSIAAALAAAQAGDRVRVEAGTYFENLVLTAATANGVQLLGGYDPTFDDGARDPQANRTVVNGGGANPAVTTVGVNSATVVDGFVLTGGGGTPGAGVLVTGGSPLFSNNEITGNRRAGIAGGAYVRGGSSVRFEDNLFANNSSQGSGGGLRVENSASVICRNTFEDCVAPNGGGGLYVFQSAVACSGNTFRDCRAGDSGGGGAYFQNVTTAAVMTDNAFERCQASIGGGMMIRDASIVTVDGISFDDCHAITGPDSMGFGGGFAVTNFCDVSVQSPRFTNCSAAPNGGKGGGFFGRQSTIQLLGVDATDPSTGALFEDCSADSGGGFYVIDCVNGVFSDVRVTNCTANYGGGIFFDTSGFMITENIVEGCTALDGGGVVFFTARSPAQSPPVSNFLNNTIYGCAATLSGTPPGGGILHQSAGFQSTIAVIAGNIVAGTTVGAGIRCRGVNSSASRPTINCSSFHNMPGNADDVISNAQCRGAFSSGVGNLASDWPDVNLYNGPDFCDLTSYELRDDPGNQDLDSTCSTSLPGRSHRGASDTICPAFITSVQEASWGEIKAKYR